MPKQPRRITLYIIHLWEPVGSEKHQARHYVGATKDYSRRMAEHHRGAAKKGLMAYARRAGIRWVSSILSLDASWEDERRIKRAGHYDRVCPVCRGDMPF